MLGRAEVAEPHPLALRWLFLKLLVLDVWRVRKDADVLVEFHQLIAQVGRGRDDVVSNPDMFLNYRRHLGVVVVAVEAMPCAKVPIIIHIKNNPRAVLPQDVGHLFDRFNWACYPSSVV